MIKFIAEEGKNIGLQHVTKIIVESFAFMTVLCEGHFLKCPTAWLKITSVEGLRTRVWNTHGQSKGRGAPSSSSSKYENIKRNIIQLGLGAYDARASFGDSLD